MRRAALACLFVTAVFILPAAGRASAPAPATEYVDVSVATVWTSPSSPRAIDQPALGNPANLPAWPGVLDTAARLGLVGRIQTQALLGEAVRVLARRGPWTDVAVTDQPSPRSPLGYPGWVPSRQLTVGASGFGGELRGPIAVVTAPTAMLSTAQGRLDVSYGTRLPLVGDAGGRAVVGLPGGSTAEVARAAVAAYSSPASIPRPTGQDIVDAARAFLGVRYLWGGTSAFGFDCSGLLELVFGVHGIVIPRDADAQAEVGRPVAWAGLRPGDLLFYGRPDIDHVALYAGAGMMIEAPDSAGSVRLTPARSADLAGTRRYVP